ncbi:MAG: ADP-ribosylglycohydrolase family protein [Clostridia bacterium]|nr:ADP-ribosylglycohydrolase family protein [Clostridia bacterium]
MSFYKLAEGAILGFVVADALGVPAEFQSREKLKIEPITDMVGGGAHGQVPGTWSDDSSMTLGMIDSLAENGIDYNDQMMRFADWLWEAKYTAHDEVFDVGGATKSAIFKFVKGTESLMCGGIAENSCGNGSLMRILPLALYLVKEKNATELTDAIATIIHDTSKCTHAHPRCLIACGIYCSVVFHLCCGTDLKSAIKEGVDSALAYYENKDEFKGVYHEFLHLKGIENAEEDQIGSTGFVIHTLEASLWCLLTTGNYRDCVLRAVNLGSDTDTTAAVAGGLAGLWYGCEQIGEEWIEMTAKTDLIKQMVKEFAGEF